MGVHEHHEKARLHVGCAIVTVSDTRTEETDESGARIRELLTEAGHEVVAYRIVRDEPALIRSVLEPLLPDAKIQAVLLNGGTGIAPRDTTFEAVRGLFEKEIEGFGELFRLLSYQEIGPAAMLSRATAGIISGKVVISMPGSTAAVDLAMRRLVLPEIGHMVQLLRE